VPISLVYRKDLVKKDGSDAFLLDAYVRPLLNTNAPFALLSSCICSTLHMQQPPDRCIAFSVLQGAYEVSNDVYFSSSRLALLDRGFVFGVAHVRGGGDLGRLW
jgi:protease II